MSSPSTPPPGATGVRAATSDSSASPVTPPPSHIGLRGRVDRVFTWCGFDPPGRWLAILGLFVLLDIVILSWVQVIAYNSYFTFSQDFGSFTQIFYTTTHDHLLLWYTSNIPSGSNGTFMAVHFAPLIFLLLPFYALAPGPATLLVMKIIILAAGAFPAYGIAHRRLGSPRWGLLLGTAYLVSPITMTLNWIDFDLEVFLPFFVLCALYLLIRRRYFAFLIAWLLALATIETSVPFLLVFAVLALLGSFWAPNLVSRENRVRERIALSTALALAIIWLGLSYLTIHSYSMLGGTFGSSYASHYTVLQAQSFLQVLPQAILHPGLAGAALQAQGGDKIVYLLMLFGCFAFLPLFGEIRYLVPPLAWIGLALLSNTDQMYSFGSQYLGYVSPFLFAGAVGGIVFLRPWVAKHLATPGESPAASTASRGSARKPRWRLPRTEEALLPGVVVLAVVVTVGIGNPFLAHPVAGLPVIQYGFPSPSAHTALLNRIMALIPSTAAVLTTDHLFPQLSDRVDAYVIPSGETFAPTTTYAKSLNIFINESNYVLLDFTLDPYASQLMQAFGNYTGFGVAAAGGGIYLLERGWNGPPLGGFGGPVTVVYSSAEWATRSKGVVVNSANQTFDYPSPASVPVRADVTLWSGPVLGRILPGEYELNVTYILGGAEQTPLFAVRALENVTGINQSATVSTPSGRHYNYVPYQEPGFVVTSVNVTGTGGNAKTQTAGTATLTFEVTQLATIRSIGITSGVPFWVLVTGFSMTWLGPPPTLVPST
jgi:uncharacterized membrane protein